MSNIRPSALLHAALFGAAVLLIGCGGADPPYSPLNIGSSGPAGTFSVKASAPQVQIFNVEPFTRKIKPGTEPTGGTWTLTVAGQNGYAGTVTLASTNPSATVFNPQFGKSSVTLSPTDSSGTVALNVFVNTNQAQSDLGTSDFTITGTDSNGNKSTTTVGIDIENVNESSD